MTPFAEEVERGAGPGGGPPSNGGVACVRAAKRSILKRANSCSSPAERENLLAAPDGGEPVAATAVDPTEMPSNSSSATLADSTANS